MAYDNDGLTGDVADGVVTAEAEKPGQDPSNANLVKKIQKTISLDKRHHKQAFDNMRRDMYVARHGCLPNSTTGHYKANLAGRHVKQKTASLYAKNPKAAARRRETLDFAVWDEKPQSLQMALATIQSAQHMQAANPDAGIEDVPQEMLQAFEQAMAVVQDYQQGMQRRTTIQKIGKTLEILFAQALREQQPVDFKTGCKQLVRRACTTGVGYVELAFQRETGPRPGLAAELADFRSRLDHLRALSERQSGAPNEDGYVEPVEPDDPEIAELELAIAALQSEPEIVLREGLIFDFPQATKVIPDRLCRNLTGFVGARHVTVEYMYTCEQVEELFGVDLKKNYTGYSKVEKGNESGVHDLNDADVEEPTEYGKYGKGEGLVCVWKHYDRTAGLVYYVADGHPEFLREPASPDVFVENFWPVFALTFNEVESETELFPPSDVALLLDMQLDYNWARQGMREHRKAARPRWVHHNGSIEDADAKALAGAEPFTSTGVNLEPNRKIGDVLETVPVPGVDPNLYETRQYFTDVQLTVGTNESQFGGVSKATATEAAIASNATASSDQSSIDDLDAFLTAVARAAGQILMREMSEEQVMQMCGPGAVWPNLSLSEIASEIYLEVEAGSTGKPNQAVEINNWQQMLPFLIQMPGIDPVFMARETLRRLDDRMDLTEALAADVPSIMAMNQMNQVSTGNPATDPNAQGPQGADNASAPDGAQAGSGPAFGSNQV